MKQTLTFPIWLALLAILIFAWLTRLNRLGSPANFVFDETYHLPAVRLIASGDQRAFEWWHEPVYGPTHFDWLHPPLAKYLQAWSWSNLGETFWAARLPAAVFGTVGILLTFVIAQLAFGRPVLSLLAALLLALDGLWLVQSRVIMNDIFTAVWLLVGTAAYLWYRRQQHPSWLLLVGFVAGLAIATKWSAGLWLMGLLIWESLERLRFKKLYQLPWVVFCLLILPLGLYILSYWPLFWQGKGLGYFLDLQVQIWRYQLAGAGNHAYQSQPWQWLLNLRPVWYWSNGTDRHIYAFNNPLLAWFEVGALGLLLTGVIRQTKPLIKYSLHFLLMLVGVLLIPWFFSPRIVFYYHFTPVTPLLAILLALVLDTLYLRRPTNLSKLIFFSLIIGLVWTFWLYYPNWVGLPVGQNTRETIYWLLPNWR